MFNVCFFTLQEKLFIIIFVRNRNLLRTISRNVEEITEKTCPRKTVSGNSPRWKKRRFSSPGSITSPLHRPVGARCPLVCGTLHTFSSALDGGL
jgi:hypothetical protein